MTSEEKSQKFKPSGEGKQFATSGTGGVRLVPTSEVSVCGSLLGDSLVDLFQKCSRNNLTLAPTGQLLTILHGYRHLLGDTKQLGRLKSTGALIQGSVHQCQQNK